MGTAHRERTLFTLSKIVRRAHCDIKQNNASTVDPYHTRYTQDGGQLKCEIHFALVRGHDREQAAA